LEQPAGFRGNPIAHSEDEGDKMGPPEENLITEGSLEVKLPTIWTDDKQRWEESEKRREEDQKRESLRRKKIQVRKKVGKSRNTVFFQ